MTVFVIAALVAFGGYLITIPRLVYDEWSARRAIEAAQTKAATGESKDHSEVHTWKPLITM